MEEGGVTYQKWEPQGWSQDLVYHVAQAQGHSTILLSAGRQVATEPLLSLLEPVLVGLHWLNH